MSLRSLASTCVLLLAAGAPLRADDPPPATEPPPPAPATEKRPPRRGEGAPEDEARKKVREGLDAEKHFAEVGRRIAQLEGEYAQATEWVEKSILCVELADLADRRAVPCLARALLDDELMVQAFALYGLKRFVSEDLKAGGGAPLVTGLIETLKERGNFHKRVSRVLLARIAGEDLGDSAAKWKSWLKKNEGELVIVPLITPWDPSKHDPELVERVRAEGATEGTRVRERIPSITTEVREMNRAGLDIAFCLDQTSSMDRVIAEAKAKLELMATLVGLVVKDHRFALVTYDDALQLTAPLTPNIDALRAALEPVKAEGGGDIPEGVDKALDGVCKPAIGWRKKSVKVVVIIGDAPPRNADVPAALELAKTMKEKLGIVTHAVSTGRRAVPELDQIAAQGGGRGLLLADPARMVSEVLLLIFGEKLRPAMERFVPILMEIHEEERSGNERGGRGGR